MELCGKATMDRMPLRHYARLEAAVEVGICESEIIHRRHFEYTFLRPPVARRQCAALLL